jgi:hypothetical protein
MNMELVEVETPAGSRAWLPADAAQSLIRAGRVKLAGIGGAKWLQQRGPTIADAWDERTQQFRPGRGLAVR